MLNKSLIINIESLKFMLFSLNSIDMDLKFDDCSKCSKLKKTEEQNPKIYFFTHTYDYIRQKLFSSYSYGIT